MKYLIHGCIKCKYFHDVPFSPHNPPPTHTTFSYPITPFIGDVREVACLALDRSLMRDSLISMNSDVAAK